MVKNRSIQLEFSQQTTSKLVDLEQHGYSFVGYQILRESLICRAQQTKMVPNWSFLKQITRLGATWKHQNLRSKGKPSTVHRTA